MSRRTDWQANAKCPQTITIMDKL